MPFTGVVHPEQIAMLRQVLDEYCVTKQVTSRVVQAEVAEELMTLFRAGIQAPEELQNRLRQMTKVAA